MLLGRSLALAKCRLDLCEPLRLRFVSRLLLQLLPAFLESLVERGQLRFLQCTGGFFSEAELLVGFVPTAKFAQRKANMETHGAGHHRNLRDKV